MTFFCVRFVCVRESEREEEEEGVRRVGEGMVSISDMQASCAITIDRKQSRGWQCN